MTKEDKVIVETITQENTEFAKMLESTAFLVGEMGKKISERMGDISDSSFLHSSPSAFAFAVGNLIGELDIIVSAMGTYLGTYKNFREAFLTPVGVKKEDLQ